MSTACPSRSLERFVRLTCALALSACARPSPAAMPAADPERARSSTGAEQPGDRSALTAPRQTPALAREPPPALCAPSIALEDTARARVVGDGTPESCTEDALRALAAQGGAIAFDCGADPVAIEITKTIELRIDTDTIIDGGGRVTLDAGKRARHFSFTSPLWMTNQTKVVLQRLTLTRGKAPVGEYFQPIERYPKCAYGYKEGSGGAIFVRDAVLHVIDCDFVDNEAALVGPDVAGGAIYALGSAKVVIAGSTFRGNRAANGGALGMLYANPEIYNSRFEHNTAEGTGRNVAISERECPARFAHGHENQGGAGGLGGAVYFDGMNDDEHTFVICGAVFRENRANELAGALFRTPNEKRRRMRISDAVFEGNTAMDGGATFIMDNDVAVERTTFMNNRAGTLVGGAEAGGWAHGLWVHRGSVTAVNSTFHRDELTIEGDGPSSLRNVTISAAAIPAHVAVDGSIFVDVACGETRRGAHNVQWPRGTACAGGTTFADPRLAPAAASRGAVQVMVPTAPDMVRGVARDCPSTDQRGAARAPERCAAGAVEP